MKLTEERWKNLWIRLGGNSKHNRIFELIVASYTEAHRYYHNDKHISDCLDAFDKVSELSALPDVIETAIWFHDIVYDTRAADNEEKSAEMALEVLKDGGISQDICTRVYDLILKTKITNEPESLDAKLLNDIDLAILGKPENEYDVYERNVRKEYEWVKDNIYYPARKSILMSFLERGSIYFTNYFLDRYEKTARKNLSRIIDHLNVVDV